MEQGLEDFSLLQHIFMPEIKILEMTESYPLWLPSEKIRLNLTRGFFKNQNMHLRFSRLS